MKGVTELKEWNQPDESVGSDRPKRGDDVMINICSFGDAPSYHLLRDGTVLVYDPKKFKLGESKGFEKLKLVESDPDQARDEHGLSRPEF